MAEMTHAGKYHSHAVFIAGRNGFFVAHGTAWLNYRSDPDLGGVINAVTEGEESIRSHYLACHLQACMLGFNSRDACRVYAAHLACAYADGLIVFCVDNRVGFYKFGDFPGE